LAGADSSPPRTEDALVADALRAAQSEVEHYDRIEFGTVDTDVSVAAGAVNDVVRLVAELFDNATRFSPPDAPVVCEARRLGGRAGGGAARQRHPVLAAGRPGGLRGPAPR